MSDQALSPTPGLMASQGACTPVVCSGLRWLGITLDAEARCAIGAVGSRVAVMVIPTDEEAMIARHSWEGLQDARS